jgi:hypothetical protein
MAKRPALLSTRQVCEALGEARPLHRSTIARWIQSGFIVPVQDLPGETATRLFTVAEVERVRGLLSERRAS